MSNFQVLREEESTLKTNRLKIKEGKARKWFTYFNSHNLNITEHTRMYALVVKRINPDLSRRIIKNDNSISELDDLIQYLDDIYAKVIDFDSIYLK